MKPKILYKIANISGWVLLVILILVAMFTLPVMSVWAVNKIIPQETKPRKEQKQSSAVKCPYCPVEYLIEPDKTGECGKYKNVNGKIQPNAEFK